jgi:hypothetical protein
MYAIAIRESASISQQLPIIQPRPLAEVMGTDPHKRQLRRVTLGTVLTRTAQGLMGDHRVIR